MEDIVLSIVLFIIYFSIVSWFQYSYPNSTKITSSSDLTLDKRIVVPIELQNKDMSIAIGKTHDLIPEIDIDRLSLRSCRKICQHLGIKQKSNGKSTPVKDLRWQIQQQLQLKPELIVQLF